MQFSRSVVYALQSLLQLAESDAHAFVPRVRLAANGDMPERFLLEVLHGLVRCGILYSTRGGGGGFALARPADDITLLDVVEAVDGPVRAGLPIGNTIPAGVRGWLEANLDRIADTMRAELAGITLRQLVAAGGHGRDDQRVP